MILIFYAVSFEEAKNLFYSFAHDRSEMLKCKDHVQRYREKLVFLQDMNDRKVIWDPLRRKEVACTPEEMVRQWCIGNLMEHCKVPSHMMMSEVGFRLGGKQLRADIVVYDRHASPLMVVECKRPEVELSQAVLDQAIRYNMVLNVKYIMITNGARTFVYRREEDKYEFLNAVPEYNQM